jgi:hypothetical protein
MTRSESRLEAPVELYHWQGDQESSLSAVIQIDNNVGSALDLDHGGIVLQQLQPADRGSAAWKLLIAAFIFEALLWGENL